MADIKNEIKAAVEAVERELTEKELSKLRSAALRSDKDEDSEDNGKRGKRR